ncbi:MAG: hypothetical protein WAQ24_03790 [Candidatus Saccharimonadales bacterium]
MNNTTLEALVANYKPSADTIKLVQSTPIVLLVGVSGAGKDTIKHQMLQSGKYHHVVSHTTRAPRENGGIMEQDGVEYHFISKEQACNMLKNGEFVEAKEYGGNLYGTSAAELQWAKDAEKIALTDIEVQGVAEYKAISENVIAEFILPPDYKEWQRRLHSRYTTGKADESDIERRMHTAILELKEALSKPYYYFIVNDDLNEAVDAANEIAHSNNEFNRIDKSFHAWAEKLLKDLQASR